jgi:cyclic pyranopterin phosphate synthase
LSAEDYLRLIRIFLSLGIEKVRLTGGEPLLRRDLPDIVTAIRAMLTQSSHSPEVAVTTNGHLMEDLAEPLKKAGLSRVTISMDAVNPAIFERITRIAGSFEAVVRGIEAAQRAGLDPVKINCVLLRGFNDDQVESFAEFARERRVVVRFIEFMPLEEDRLWTPQMVVPLTEIVERIDRVHPLVPLPANVAGETARRYGFADGAGGEIGIIAPVTQAFCGACSRVRLTSDGKIRTCLFSHREHDLAGLAQDGASDDELRAFILGVIQTKEARHHIGEPGFLKPSRSMVHIGG